MSRLYVLPAGRCAQHRCRSQLPGEEVLPDAFPPAVPHGFSASRNSSGPHSKKKSHFLIRGWNQTSLAVGHMQCRDDLAQNPSKECTSVVCSQPRALPMALRAISLLAHVFLYTPCSLSHLSCPVCALFR